MFRGAALRPACHPPGPGRHDASSLGSHGDYEMIALCPNSPQECFDLTIRAFNLSEQFRTPVMFMTDECVGHMTEKVVIPPADQIDVYPAAGPGGLRANTCRSRPETTWFRIWPTRGKATAST